MSTLSSVVRELLEELVRMGAHRLLVLSGHAGARHMAALREAADDVQRGHPKVALAVLSDYDFVYELRGKDSPSTDGHGGLLESSRVLALAPGTVGPERPHVEDRRRPFSSGDPTPEEWAESVVGDTRPASAELGAKVQAHVLSRLEETVAVLFPRS
jgi:creatinine amidohydrolase